VTLSWTGSTDNLGVRAYRIWRNNTLIGETAATTFVDNAFSAGQTYTYFVTAYDVAGNVSARSNQVTVMIPKGKK
jgi:chitodextrinase